MPMGYFIGASAEFDASHGGQREGIEEDAHTFLMVLTYMQPLDLWHDEDFGEDESGVEVRSLEITVDQIGVLPHEIVALLG